MIKKIQVLKGETFNLDRIKEVAETEDVEIVPNDNYRLGIYVVEIKEKVYLFDTDDDCIVCITS